jgi:hypothetical protein
MMKPKELGGGRRFRPDIIIHRRLSNAENVLVIETKSRAQRGGPSDVAKLKELVAEQGFYRYWAGAFIVFHNSPSAVFRSGALRISAQWILEGHEMAKEFVRNVPSKLINQIAALSERYGR